MASQSVIHLFGSVPAVKETPLKALIKLLGSGQFRKRSVKRRVEAKTDPYLLLLLADQELVEGREDQARSLVEAAYEFFDRKTKVSPGQLYLVS